MMRFNNWGLSKKLMAAFLCLGTLPGVAIAWRTFGAIATMSDEAGKTYQTTAAAISDKIDRNLFERYGDVQAFGLNGVVSNRESWYKPNRADNAIVSATNAYVKLYGLYALSVLVDLDGRVISVNDQDATGKDIQSRWMYEKNFSQSPWFKDAVAGRFMTGESGLSGTVVQDVHVDEDVKRVFGGEGLVVGFSSPVRDDSGKIVAVWNNRANFSVVEEIVATSYQDMKAKGLGAAEFLLVDRSGRVLMDYAPAARGGKESVDHDMSALLKQNLAQAGVEAASRIAVGESGSLRAKSERSGEWQTTGFAVSKGALGYPGLGWGVIVRLDENVALAELMAVQQQLFWIMGIALVGIGVAAWLLARSVVVPIRGSLDALRDGSHRVSGTATEVASAAQTLSQGAVEQAAALEQTSASMEEMASMTRQSAEHAQQAATLIAEVDRVVSGSNKALEQMTDSMDSIRESSGKVAKIIKTIDEIAFQTNILALNAAVEAARAGEAGMGFAVVADEVRNLAQRSAQAAKDTAVLIEESIVNSQEGHANVQLVAESINAITSGVSKVKGLMGEVSEASRQQSQGIDQVAQAVAQMEKVTQSTAARAEESAAASEELNAQAEAAMVEVQKLESNIVGVHPAVASAAPTTRPRESRAKATLVKMTPRAAAPSKASQAKAMSSAEDMIPMGDTGTYGRF